MRHGATNSRDGMTHGDVHKRRESYYNKKRSEGDLFYKFFLGNMCLGRACYKDCKFKYLNSAADIRIGDLLGK